MKKTILIIFLVLFGPLLLFIVFNRFDARPALGMFTLKDLPAANFDHENGFYRLWTLGLDDAVDVEAPTVKERYRSLFDPAFDNDKEIREFDIEKYKKETNPNQRMGKALLEEMSKMDRIGDAPPLAMAGILNNKMEFVRFRERQPMILQRYERFLASEFFQDFTAPNSISPLPNLITWLRLAKIYLGLCLADASDGKWTEAATALLKQAGFAKKAVAGSRMLITNLIAKAVLNLSVQGLAFLMNQRECPTDVFSLVLENMPPISLEEYGSRNSFINEFLYFRNTITRLDTAARGDLQLKGIRGFLAPLGLQKNHTLNEYYEYLRIFLDAEASPLQVDPQRVLTPRPSRSEGLLWWLQNPVGKVFLDAGIPSLGTVVFKSLRTRALYDMTRISAELHLRYDPGKTVQETLNLLATYQSMDPCSGKPYVWNDQKQVLYSVGFDRVDGGGSYDKTTPHTDIVLPCILYVRAASEPQKNR